MKFAIALLVSCVCLGLTSAIPNPIHWVSHGSTDKPKLLHIEYDDTYTRSTDIIRLDPKNNEWTAIEGFEIGEWWINRRPLIVNIIEGKFGDSKMAINITSTDGDLDYYRIVIFGRF